MSTSGREVARRESRARLETGLGVVRMADDLTIIAGVPIPSTSPLFLSVVGSHVLAGLLCAIMGVVAMLSNKVRGATFELWDRLLLGLDGCFRDRDGSGGSPLEGGLSLVHLRKALACGGVFGPPGAPTTLVELATAAPYGNGSVRGQRQEPAAWRELPPPALWLLPSAVGVPIIVYALPCHPLVGRFRRDREP